MKLAKRTIGSLVLIIPILAGSILFAPEARFARRVMTEEEFNRLKEREGVYEEARNYNIIIDGHGTGLQPPTAEEWEEIRTMPIVVDMRESSEDSLPSSHDNSATIWFPPIGNQDGEGSCVSWACGYYTKTFQEAVEHDWDLSESVWIGGFYGYPSVGYQDKIFSPDFIYHQVNSGEDDGSKFSDNMNLLKRIGCCTWKRMPYDPLNSIDWPDENAWREAPLYRSQTGHTIMLVDTDEGLEGLKQLLADSNLAVIGVDADEYSDLTLMDLWTFDNYNPSDINHANTVVGYDDDYGPYIERGDPNTRGAFKIANSWGKGGWEKIFDGFYYISYECMKRRVGNVRIYENRVDYEPEMVSVFQLAHSRRKECQVTVGIGQTGSPDSTKRFDEYEKRGGAHPFPANKMVMDITEFVPLTSGPSDNFFLKVYDGGTDSTGIIDFFSIEQYDDYVSGIPTETYVSLDPPVNTVNYSTVYAEVASGPPDSLWIVGAGGGYPGDLLTVQVWLQYEGGGPGDSVSSIDIPLTWDAAVCTVEGLTIAPDFAAWTDMSRIDNQGTQGPPPVPKLIVSLFTWGPPFNPPYVSRGSHLAATVDFRILSDVVPPDSTCIDTLRSAFTPPRYLGFLDKFGIFTYTPVFIPDSIYVIEHACGDCNGDGNITFADALYVKNYYYQTPPGSPAPIGQGDVNLDGFVNFADALYIKNYYYQTPPGSPPPCNLLLDSTLMKERVQ